MNPERMSIDDILRAIAQITLALKGPMSNFERRCHYLDRKELRAELDRREPKVSA